MVKSRRWRIRDRASKQGHGLIRNLWPADSIHMRATRESAAKRAHLYMHSAARRRFLAEESAS